MRVRLLTPANLPQPRAEQLVITNKDLNVPSGDTTYWCQVVKLPDFVIQTVHHIVKVMSIVVINVMMMKKCDKHYQLNKYVLFGKTKESVITFFLGRRLKSI